MRTVSGRLSSADSADRFQQEAISSFLVSDLCLSCVNLKPFKAKADHIPGDRVKEASGTVAVFT